MPARGGGDAERGIELVDGAVGLDARRVLRDPRAAEEVGLAGVTPDVYRPSRAAPGGRRAEGSLGRRGGRLAPQEERQEPRSRDDQGGGDHVRDEADPSARGACSVVPKVWNSWASTCSRLAPARACSRIHSRS